MALFLYRGIASSNSLPCRAQITYACTSVVPYHNSHQYKVYCNLLSFTDECNYVCAAVPAASYTRILTVVMYVCVDG